MAGSWNHIVTKRGQFRGVELIDNLGDADEALEECYGMVWLLAHSITELTGELGTDAAAHIEDARAHYKDGIALSPGIKP